MNTLDDDNNRIECISISVYPKIQKIYILLSFEVIVNIKFVFFFK